MVGKNYFVIMNFVAILEFVLSEILIVMIA